MAVLESVDGDKVVSEQNMHSVFLSLRRLQKVYAIPASDMAAGAYKNRTIGDPVDGNYNITL